MIDSNITFVITAREASTRIPLKPYLKADGIYILDKILNFVEEVAKGRQIILTSESLGLLDIFSRKTISCIQTSAKITSGTERLVEVSSLVKSNYYLMIPCDIWLETSNIINYFMEKCIEKNIDCATLVKPISSKDQFSDPSSVKVVHDRDGVSLFFARILMGNYEEYLPYISQQLGMYYYSYELLQFFRNTEPTKYELVENNESFRFLLNGRRMFCINSDCEIHSLNTLADIEKLSSFKNVTMKGINDER